MTNRLRITWFPTLLALAALAACGGGGGGGNTAPAPTPKAWGTAAARETRPVKIYDGTPKIAVDGTVNGV